MPDRKPLDEQAAPAFVAAKKALSALYARPRVERLEAAHAAVDRLWADLTGLEPEREGERVAAEGQGPSASSAKPRVVA